MTPAIAASRKSWIKLDPRIGILCTVTVSCILIGGRSGGWMDILRTLLALFPLALLLLTGRIRTAIKYGTMYAIVYSKLKWGCDEPIGVQEQPWIGCVTSPKKRPHPQRYTFALQNTVPKSRGILSGSLLIAMIILSLEFIFIVLP